MWPEKNGTTWRIRDEVNGKKITVEKGWPTKTAAKTRIIELRADKMRGEYIDPRGGKLSLGEWVEKWWPAYEPGLKPTARQSEGSRLRMHIVPLLGHLPLEEVEREPLTVQTWVADLLAGRGPMPGKRRRRKLAPKSVRNCHGLLHKIMGAAIRQRLIRSNPCAETQLPEMVPHEMRFLSEPEMGRLVSGVPAHWRPLVLLLLTTGLRWGEATGLRVQDVDVLAGKLSVVRAMHELATGELVFGTPKTARGRRTVTFPKVQVGTAVAPLLTDKDRADLVFSAPMGGPVRTRNFRRGWVKWTKAAGLAGLRIHDLRHTHAAILISAGRPLTAISRRLGHASIAVTDAVYGHLMDYVDEGIISAIEDALEHVDLAEFEAEVAEEFADAA